MKRFNTTAVCLPNKHYMVNLESRLRKIKKIIDYGDYFIINRARQYGKTTLLRALKDYLRDDYVVISLDFQRLSDSRYADENKFVETIFSMISNNIDIKSGYEKPVDLFSLTDFIIDLCRNAEKPIVLMIDEIDKVSNISVFLGFLAQLRYLYINRDESPTFQSVILAGIKDVRLLKSGIREENDHTQNSPWNIAVDFDIDMSFSTEDIEAMLKEYSHINNKEIDTFMIAKMIHDYTSGYPFLVSRICQIIDEQFEDASWSKDDILLAINYLLKDNNTLFKDMVKKLEDYPELKKMIKSILIEGKLYPFNLGVFEIELGFMYGFIKNDESKAVVSNRIFETYLYNLFIDEDRVNSLLFDLAVSEKNIFIKDGKLDMDLVMEKFFEHYCEIYTENDITFLEDNARKQFLLYIRPIINGVGNYYIEAQTRDMKRTDIIIDYKGFQYIIELKIWHGEEYNKRGEKQLKEYLDFYNLDKGYMISFNFNKNKKTGIKKILLEDKEIMEVVV